jgi:succinate dehydrogenase / fumarate reductase flavoprotein subunit
LDFAAAIQRYGKEQAFLKEFIDVAINSGTKLGTEVVKK